jgi:acyl-CoA thioesterase
MSELHPLDDALRLEPAAPGLWRGRTTPAYWNMAGPFGGVTAATLLRAVLDHPERRGRPAALTVNFCGAVAEGPFEVAVRLVRDGRSTQHWQAELSQEGRGVATTASVVTVAERETWGLEVARAPAIAPFEAVESAPTKGRPGWTARYDMRFAEGPPPFGGRAGGGPGGTIESPYSKLWVRDAPARPLDYPALAAISDCFIVRILQVRGDLPPVATATLTTYFLAGEAELAVQGDRPLIGVADAKAFRHGFNDQTAELWSPEGVLLATSTQIVWFKG